MIRKFFILFCTIFSLLITGAASAFAQEEEAPPRADSYQLSVRDLIKFAVLDEPETELEQRIDGEGRIRVPYLGNVQIAGLNIREAEEMLERAYVENDIYTKLQATIRVVEYSVKEASVLGQVKKPGNVPFPIEMNGIDIREVISQAGGFTTVARSKEVRVTRFDKNGNEKVFTVNVDRMLSGSGRGNSDDGTIFHVRPGDVIFVPERFF